MNVNGTHYRSLWWSSQAAALQIIDQRWLPHELRIQTVDTLRDFYEAIAQMRVRGAPLIGATAAYGVALGMKIDPSDQHLDDVAGQLAATRPTAINLHWAINRAQSVLQPLPATQRAQAALALAHQMAEEDVETNRQLGEHGARLIEALAANQPAGQPVNILTHCNAGWLATVDWGTATSPMFQAHDAGVNIHIWVDETRPRNQGR